MTDPKEKRLGREVADCAKDTSVSAPVCSRLAILDTERCRQTSRAFKYGSLMIPLAGLSGHSPAQWVSRYLLQRCNRILIDLLCAGTSYEGGVFQGELFPP